MRGLSRKAVRLYVLIAFLALIFSLNACSEQKTATVEEDASVLNPGKEIYETNCSSCHGTTGEGDGPAGLDLKPRPRNYVKDGFKYGSTIEEIKLTIRDGLEDTQMPSWKEALSDEEITHVAQYVRYLASRRAK